MSKWKNFTDGELKCSHCGKSNPNPEFEGLMDTVQEMRTELDFGFNVTSAYRCPEHPIEAAKGTPGQHSIAAIDINVYGEKALALIALAQKKGIKGIGVNQKGPYHKRFIHLDPRELPAIWSY